MEESEDAAMESQIIMTESQDKVFKSKGALIELVRAIGRKNNMSQKKTDGDSTQKKRRPKASGTKKCECPFALRGINIAGDEWTLEVICGVHNHPPSQSLHGHSYAGCLSKEEHAMLVDMSTSLMKPKDILTALKKRDKDNILRTFPHVLIMDCTYKTNRYCFPLFEIVGVTSTEKTFNVAFVYMSREVEDNYTWALSRLKTLLQS
ncbi:uncharacterized protein LOC121052734 [Rosa chinensis]|uniref:uncharacterized protein LOC121052734 n=1 Tax=Rosa chinensis TaxID=74649 RepID=UPI001AD8CE20|nr:uncharacterized protein LOC121052734 [Rosa chinensis]